MDKKGFYGLYVFLLPFTNCYCEALIGHKTLETQNVDEKTHGDSSILIRIR